MAAENAIAALLEQLTTGDDIAALFDRLQCEPFDWAAFNAEAEQAVVRIFDALTASTDDGKAGHTRRCNTTARTRRATGRQEA